MDYVGNSVQLSIHPLLEDMAELLIEGRYSKASQSKEDVPLRQLHCARSALDQMLHVTAMGTGSPPTPAFLLLDYVVACTI